MIKSTWRLQLRCIHESLAPLLSIAVLCISSANVWAQEQDWIQSWVFNGRTEKSVRERFELQASQKIEQLKTSCTLTEEQLGKLRLAAAGDVSRFFHDVARVREATAGKRMQDQNAVQEAWAIISPLAARMQKGIYEEDSLLNKVLASILDKTQQQEYDRVREEQVQRRHHAIVLTTVAAIEEGVPLLAEQRLRLIELIDRQQLKPKIIPHNYETYIGYLKLSQVPEEELAALLDQEQLATIKRMLVRRAPLIQEMR
jgi:hypothetical protein